MKNEYLSLCCAQDYNGSSSSPLAYNRRITPSRLNQIPGNFRADIALFFFLKPQKSSLIQMDLTDIGHGYESSFMVICGVQLLIYALTTKANTLNQHWS